MMKTLGTHIKIGISLLVFTLFFQPNCLAQFDQHEWEAVSNLFNAVQKLTPHHIRVSLFDEMADEDGAVFQHKTGILLFMSTLTRDEFIDPSEILHDGIHSFNGVFLRPFGDIYELSGASGIGMTYSGTIGGVAMWADQIIVNDEEGSVFRVLAIRADQIGSPTLPKCVDEWIESNFQHRPPVSWQPGGQVKNAVTGVVKLPG